MKRLPAALYLFVTVQGLWLLWSGHYEPLMLLFSLLCSTGVVLLSSQLGILDHELAPLNRLPAVLRYTPWLAWEVVKSNLDVARRVLSPSLPIDPQVIRVRASQSDDLGRVTYANSITLTPGTVTIDAEEEVLTVHALAAESAAGLRGGGMDRKVTAVLEGR